MSGVGSRVQGVKNSFDDDLLTTLCEASWGISANDLTDEFLQEQIHAITDSYQNHVLPPSRVTDYFKSCNLLIKKYGFTSFFEGEKGIKKKCKLLINSLPELLKEKVKNEIGYRSPDSRTSVLKLSKLINQQALEQVIEDRALKRSKGPAQKSKPRDQPRPFQNKKRQANKQPHQPDTRPKKLKS
ncbi:Cleavage induced Hypothetical protein [Phytophthora palmivora]|uniref:Uncharacterized protein n=1 Tax=Phytophthora palmivora TaxID=4796 RepID=A0A2P4X1D1_9STRA|nr:Cleavage induced Hypothetical protein [Phytophthora palmivora]